MKKIFLSLLICALFANSALAAMSDDDFFHLIRRIGGGSGSLQSINDAIRGGANVNAVGHRGETPLTVVADIIPANIEISGGNPKIILEAITVLLQAGANINPRGDTTPLIAAAGRSGGSAFSLEVMSTLLRAGADVNAPSEIGITPLMEAALNGCPEAVRLLLEAGADVNARGQRRLTALIQAAKNSRHDTLTPLINAGADVNATDSNGTTPLMEAAYRLPPESIAILIRAGANVNARCAGFLGGRTPLINSVFNANPEAIVVLLEAGADPAIRDNQGKMAIDHANDFVRRPGGAALRDSDVLQRLAEASGI